MREEDERGVIEALEESEDASAYKDVKDVEDSDVEKRAVVAGENGVWEWAPEVLEEAAKVWGGWDGKVAEVEVREEKGSWKSLSQEQWEDKWTKEEWEAYFKEKEAGTKLRRNK